MGACRGAVASPRPAPGEAKAHVACRSQVGLCTTGERGNSVHVGCVSTHSKRMCIYKGSLNAPRSKKFSAPI